MSGEPTGALAWIRRLWTHARWADQSLAGELGKGGEVPEAAVREFAHGLGAAEVWLARLERRPARLAVWPQLEAARLRETVQMVHAGYEAFLSSLGPSRLAESVSYVNSAGREFANPVGEILTHAALHGQYHRGKVNLLLRQAGLEPVPADYIAFVRGAPAATSKPR